MDRIEECIKAINIAFVYMPDSICKGIIKHYTSVIQRMIEEEVQRNIKEYITKFESGLAASTQTMQRYWDAQKAIEEDEKRWQELIERCRRFALMQPSESKESLEKCSNEVYKPIKSIAMKTFIFDKRKRCNIRRTC